MLCLLEHGANPNAVEPVNKASVLHLACEKGCSDIADLFIKYKANVNQKDGHGSTPLMAACKNGHLGIAQLLLQRYIRVDCIPGAGWGSLQHGIKTDCLSIISL